MMHHGSGAREQTATGTGPGKGMGTGTGGRAETQTRRAHPFDAQAERAGTGQPSDTRTGAVREAIEAAVGTRAFQRFFTDTVRISSGREGVVVAVGTRFEADRIRSRFGPVLESVSHSLTGAAPTVRVEHAGSRSTPAPRAEREPTPAPASTPRPQRDKDLSSFVVGHPNRLAFAAAQRVLEDDLSASPLVVHGGCGNGKTHLLRAVVAEWRRMHPDRRARYVTAEQFTNAFLSALKRNAVAEFQSQFRSLSLLCVDDIQFFGHKSATQSELLHTFDAIELSGARVVLASDEHPRALASLNEALISRFVSGAVVEVGEPDAELREAFVRASAARRGLPIDDAAIRAVAHGIGLASEGTSAKRPASVRDLEGALTRVEAVWRLMPELRSPDGRVGALLAARAAAMSASKPDPQNDARPVPLDTVVRTVTEVLGVERSEMVGKGRHKRVVLARSMVARVARQVTNASFPEIARAIGRTNHSTVITAFQRVSGQIERSEPVAVGSRFDGTPYGELAAQLERETRARAADHQGPGSA